MKKRLYKDKSTAVFMGVLSGIAQYFNIDVKIVRIIFFVAALITNILPCVIIYIVLAFIMPDKDDIGHRDYTVE